MRIFSVYVHQYKGLSKNAWQILFTTFFYSLGTATVKFLPIYIHDALKYSLLSTGFSIGMYGVGTAIASFYGGKFCDKISARFVSIISLSTSIVLLLFLYFVTSPYWLMLMLLTLFGVTNAAFYPASRIYLMRFTETKIQQKATAVRYMLCNIGAAASFGIAGFFMQTEFNRIFLITIFCSCLALWGLVFYCPKETNHSIAVTKTKDTFWDDKFLIIIFICFLLGMLVFAQANTSYSLFLFNDYHLSTSQLGNLFILNCLLIIFFQVPLVNLVSQMNQTKLMLMGIFIMGIGFIMLLFGHTYFLAILSTIIWTIGEMWFMPISQNIIYQKTKAHLKGQAMGIYQFISSMAFIVSPILGTMALNINANGVLLWGSTFALSILSIILYFFLRQTEKKP